MAYLPFIVDPQAAAVSARPAGISRQLPAFEQKRELGFLDLGGRQQGLGQCGYVQGRPVMVFLGAVADGQGIAVEEEFPGLRIIAVGLYRADIACAA